MILLLKQLNYCEYSKWDWIIKNTPRLLCVFIPLLGVLSEVPNTRVNVSEDPFITKQKAANTTSADDTDVVQPALEDPVKDHTEQISQNKTDVTVAETAHATISRRSSRPTHWYWKGNDNEDNATCSENPVHPVVSTKTVHEQADDFKDWNRQSVETEFRFEDTAIPLCKVDLDHIGNQCPWPSSTSWAS